MVLAVLAWLAAPPQSLGEAAKRETLRRQILPKASTLLTNAGQPPEVPLTVSPPSSEPAKAAPASADAGPVKDEKWWRERIGTARETLARDQMTAENLQTRINVLQRDAVNVDDPIRQANLREELRKTLEELGRAQKLIEADQKAIVEIQEEARRANVPAGWTR
jgi:hypothetical protein